MSSKLFKDAVDFCNSSLPALMYTCLLHRMVDRLVRDRPQVHRLVGGFVELAGIKH